MTATGLDLANLRARIAGRVVAPGDEEYDAVRAVLLGGLDPRPAVVVRPTSKRDVAEAIGYARSTGLELAVRSGGHSGAGHSTVDDGLVIDLRDLKRLEVDPAGRTAWAAAGLTAGEFTTAAAEHHLAVGFGDTGSVGISRITLGGGVGFLSRRLGLTVDSLLAAELVTAEGQELHVDANSHPELFWALRGGGGNFGVVTRLQFRLHSLDQVVGGMLLLPATPATLAGFVGGLLAAPEELSGIANVMPCPPLPFVPPEHHGRLALLGLLCFAGDADDGAAALHPFRSLAEPLVDLVRPIPYPEMFPPANPDYHPVAVARTLFADGFDEATAASVLEGVTALDGMRAVQLRVLGGAVSRVPGDATAYPHRSEQIMGNVAAFYDGPEDLAIRATWVDQMVDLLDGSGARYVNFLADEGPEQVRAAYPGATWDRLRAVKRTYDPDNVFHRNQNVPPA